LGGFAISRSRSTLEPASRSVDILKRERVDKHHLLRRRIPLGGCHRDRKVRL
jgi:hypothetical protein